VSFAEIQQATGGLWPYLVVIVVGFLPTEVWRVIGVFAGRRLDEQSEVMIWVRLVASALVAGVVAKLILTPSGALAAVPLIGRAGALAIGFVAFFVLRRSVLGALGVGLAAVIAAGALYAP
jgi:hypothetical protein